MPAPTRTLVARCPECSLPMPLAPHELHAAEQRSARIVICPMCGTVSSRRRLAADAARRAGESGSELRR